jgi:hypothetical protein
MVFFIKQCLVHGPTPNFLVWHLPRRRVEIFHLLPLQDWHAQRGFEARDIEDLGDGDGSCRVIDVGGFKHREDRDSAGHYGQKDEVGEGVEVTDES